jgi:hypothetical protein
MVRTNQGLAIGRMKPIVRLAATWGIALVFVLGCRDDGGLGRRYPVHGRVTYRSQPLRTGQVTFRPIDTTGPARDATGTIQDGSYTLSTLGGDDGAFPGRYRVAISAKSAEPSKIQPVVPGGAANPFDAIRAARQSKDLIPQKYQSPNTSGLTREVKAETNRIDVDLAD